MADICAKQVIVADSAGFCYGVRRAVRMVEKQIEGGRPVSTLGPIIHNPHVVKRLAGLGANPIANVQGAKPGETVVIRSHGAEKGCADEIASRGAIAQDATCPHVRRIHEIVAAAKAGQSVVIIGDATHPEICAIVSYSGVPAYVVSDREDIASMPHLASALVVAQTTSMRGEYNELLEILRGHVLSIEENDTICEATVRRQSEAVDIAKKVEVMLIIGGRDSANTRRLYELCKLHTEAYCVEDASELPIRAVRAAKTIGITAGASTPDEIIKEVVTCMNELDNKTPTEIQDTEENTSAPVAEEMVQQPVAQEAKQEPTMDDSSSFMAEFEKTLVSIKPGQVVVGTIVQITEDEVCVNIGYKSDGIIPKAELDSEGDPRQQFKTGDEIEVEVVKVNDGEGNVLLSQRNIQVMRNWDILMEQHERGEYVEGVGKDVVKGGLICTVMGVRTFVPASQLAERYVEKIDQFIGQPMKLKIIEVDRSKRRLVASRKAVLIEESKKIKETLWDKLVIGETIHGVVRRLTEFGAFVDIGGMDGLIHVTDLSWGRVRHPSDVVKPNDEVDVQILGVDRERERISLGLKQLQAKPWDNAPLNYPVGSIVEGKVVRMVTFGAFVELEPGLDGLVHISQIASTRVNRVEDVLQVGQIINAKVLDVNSEAKRISLSIREALGAVEIEDELGELPEDLGEAVLAASSETVEPDVDEPLDEPQAAQAPEDEPAPVAEESAGNEEEPVNE